VTTLLDVVVLLLVRTVHIMVRLEHVVHGVILRVRLSMIKGLPPRNINR
jgi:hypothetical protein